MSGLSPLTESGRFGILHPGIVDKTKLSGGDVSFIFVISLKEKESLLVK